MEGVHLAKKALLHDLVIRSAQVCPVENIHAAQSVLKRQALEVPSAGHSWEGYAHLVEVPLQGCPD